MRKLTISAVMGFAVLVMQSAPSFATDWNSPVQMAQAHSVAPDQGAVPAGGEKQQSPEEKMRARWPQPVKVGDLIGLPVLDWWDSTIGYVQQVVRTPEGKIVLVVPYGKWFGWLRTGSVFDRRLVAVPIERVAILARQIAAIDMEREQFEAVPTWSSSGGQPIPPGEIIRIAIYNR